jgi:hypothetical protein
MSQAVNMFTHWLYALGLIQPLPYYKHEKTCIASDAQNKRNRHFEDSSWQARQDRVWMSKTSCRGLVRAKESKITILQVVKLGSAMHKAGQS